MITSEEKLRRRKANHHNYYLKNREKLIKRAVAWGKGHIEKRREYNRSSLHRTRFSHMPGYDYATARRDSGVMICDCCGDPVDKPSNWCTDHSHSLNVVRGVICRNCNCALGHVKDSIPRLEACIEYLRNPPALRHTNEARVSIPVGLEGPSKN